MGAAQPFLDAREFLLPTASGTMWRAVSSPGPRWRFNWALDWFDTHAAGNSGLAVHVASVDGVLGVLLPGWRPTGRICGPNHRAG